jgi:hypothetical protein
MLRRLIFGAETLLIGAGTLDVMIRGYGRGDEVESPEFLFKAHIEKLIDAMRYVVKGIPESVENAGVVVQVLSKVSRRLGVVCEPRFEERSLFAIGV